MENTSKTINVTPTPVTVRSRRPSQHLIDNDVSPQKVLNSQLLLFMCGVLKINFAMNSISISLQFSLLKCETNSKKCFNVLKSKAHKENKKQQEESKTEVQELDAWDFASFLTKCTLFCGNYD